MLGALAAIRCVPRTIPAAPAVGSPIAASVLPYGDRGSRRWALRVPPTSGRSYEPPAAGGSSKTVVALRHCRLPMRATGRDAHWCSPNATFGAMDILGQAAPEIQRLCRNLKGLCDAPACTSSVYPRQAQGTTRGSPAFRQIVIGTALPMSELYDLDAGRRGRAAPFRR